MTEEEAMKHGATFYTHWKERQAALNDWREQQAVDAEGLAMSADDLESYRQLVSQRVKAFLGGDASKLSREDFERMHNGIVWRIMDEVRERVGKARR